MRFQSVWCRHKTNGEFAANRLKIVATHGNREFSDFGVNFVSCWYSATNTHKKEKPNLVRFGKITKKMVDRFAEFQENSPFA